MLRAIVKQLRPQALSAAQPGIKTDERRTAIGRQTLLALIVLCMVGCDFPGDPNSEDHGAAKTLSWFDPLYATNCAGCHGVNGKLGPAPPLNDPLFLAIISDDSLMQVIRKGRSGTPMPAFSRADGGTLTEAQIRLLAAGIRRRWRTEPSPVQLAPPYLVAGKIREKSAGDLQRTLKLFSGACGSCHGEKGGGGDAGSIADPAFLGLISDQALRRYVITGRPDLGMPGYQDPSNRPSDYQPLTSAEINDIVALLRHFQKQDPVAANRGLE